MYPKEKEQVIELINDIISIMLSGNVSNKYFGKAVYSGWSGSVEIIEPMLDLRIALSEAVSEIYGVDKYAFFDKLFKPVITQDDVTDVSDELHEEIVSFFVDAPEKMDYIKKYPELIAEIEKASK